jgi:hypothetical protein
VTEHDGLAFTPVLIENLNSILCFDKAHFELLVIVYWLSE